MCSNKVSAHYVHDGGHLILAGSPLALVAYTFRHDVLVWVSFASCLVTALCRCSPDTDRVHVSLGLTSTTSVSMIGYVILASAGNASQDKLTRVHG